MLINLLIFFKSIFIILFIFLYIKWRTCDVPNDFIMAKALGKAQANQNSQKKMNY